MSHTTDGSAPWGAKSLFGILRDARASSPRCLRTYLLLYESELLRKNFLAC